MINDIMSLLGRTIKEVWTRDRQFFLEFEDGEQVCFGMVIRDSYAPEEVGIIVNSKDSYDEKFGDDRVCSCGHSYYRHFDSYDRMYPIGCKYCRCRTFKEESDEVKKIRQEAEADRKAQKDEMHKWEDQGEAVWLEWGKICHAPLVDPYLFGPHYYGDEGRTGVCIHKCGCHMGSMNSSGPVDPFGRCPNNPREKNND